MPIYTSVLVMAILYAVTRQKYFCITFTIFGSSVALPLFLSELGVGLGIAFAIWLNPPPQTSKNPSSLSSTIGVVLKALQYIACLVGASRSWCHDFTFAVKYLIRLIVISGSRLLQR